MGQSLRYPHPRLGEDIHQEHGNAEYAVDLGELPPVFGSNLGLNKALSAIPFGHGLAGAGRESASGEVLLHQGVLLVPTFTEPDVKGLCVAEWDISNTEAAPVEVDGLWGPTLKVSTRQREVLLTVLTSTRQALVHVTEEGQHPVW